MSTIAVLLLLMTSITILPLIICIPNRISLDRFSQKQASLIILLIAIFLVTLDIEFDYLMALRSI